MSRAWLIPLDNPGARHAIPTSGLLIGREQTCDLRLCGPTVSAKQCWICSNSECFEVEDKSSNGTFLNGRLLGRNQRMILHEGDLIQMTRKWQTNSALQFRFTTVEADRQHVRDECPSEVAQHMQVPNAPLESVADGSRHCDSSIEEDIRKMQVDVSAMENHVNQLSTKIKNLGANSEPLHRPGSADSIRTANAEALLEAERTRLLAQRAVLEAELAGLRATYEQYKRSHSDAQIACECEQGMHKQLEEELNAVVNDLAQLKGQHEALQIGLEEAGQEMRWNRSRLEPVADLAAGLEACRDRHMAEVETSVSAERELALMAESRTSSLKKLHHVSRLLAEEMQSQADRLVGLIDSCSPHSDENVPPRSTR